MAHLGNEMGNFHSKLFLSTFVAPVPISNDDDDDAVEMFRYKSDYQPVQYRLAHVRRQ